MTIQIRTALIHSLSCDGCMKVMSTDDGQWHLSAETMMSWADHLDWHQTERGWLCPTCQEAKP